MSNPVDRFEYISTGTSPLAIPAGCYVTGFTFVSLGGGTLQITAEGPDVAPYVGPTITLEPSFPFSMAKPVLDGDRNEIGPGSTFTFTSVDSFVIAVKRYQG